MRLHTIRVYHSSPLAHYKREAKEGDLLHKFTPVSTHSERVTSGSGDDLNLYWNIGNVDDHIICTSRYAQAIPEDSEEGTR
jgi:hypothetical protein